MSGASANLRRYVQHLVEVHRFGSLSDHQLLERFAAQRDEAAFALLVRRHGPMVLGVCRRLLGHEQDAEDAFQAVFLILARKAGAIRQAEVGGFLYRVSYRVAVRARGRDAKRHFSEQRAEAPAVADPATEAAWGEVRQVVDEELQRLPEGPRSALVLCYLEGKTQDEAARLLGWSKSTLRRRLDQGRERLRQRLLRRGLAPMAALTASLFAEETAMAVPAALAGAAVRAAVSGTAATAVAALAEASGAVAFVGKAKAATQLLLAMCMLSGVGVWLGSGFLASPQHRQGWPSLTLRADEKAGKREAAKTIEIKGRVLDPDRNPVRDAKLLLAFRRNKDIPNKIWAVSGADGRFQFTMPRLPWDESPWESAREHPYVLSAAKGYGLAVAKLDKPEAAANLTLRLVKDDVPIRGRILDLQGKPIAGVRVHISDHWMFGKNKLYFPKQGSLTDWLAALKTGRRTPGQEEQIHLTGVCSPSFDSIFPPITTGEDGRFEIRGIGRERLADLRLDGPTIATQIITVMTRSSDIIREPWDKTDPKGRMSFYYGADCEILAQPTKPVVGVVRDRDTGKPLAGATIMTNKIANPWNISNHEYGLVRTTTDKEGRYRLIGLPKGEDNQVVAAVDGFPYLPDCKKVQNTPGLGPVTVDFALKRGIWVTGRVTEKTTGKPLRGSILYFCFNDNPYKNEIPRYFFHSSLSGVTREDGSYRIVAAPGHGLIAMQVLSHGDRYLGGVGAEKIKTPHVHLGGGDYFDTSPLFCSIPNREALVEINPKPGDESITCDLIAVPDRTPRRTLKGTVLGPDGKPLAGARRNRDETLPGSEFTVEGLPPGKLSEPRVIEFDHEGKKLAGLVTVHGDENEPLQVRLQPWGAVIGRLVTPEGEPLTGVWVHCAPREEDDLPDKKGRFRIEGLTPGLKYNVWVSKKGRSLTILGGEPKDLIVKPGETLDLGVLKVKVME